MNLTLAEVSALTGRNKRTLRGLVLRGELPAKKVGTKWVVNLDDVPMTEAQRAAVLARSEQVATTISEQLPSRTTLRRGKKFRSLADTEVFRTTHALLSGMAARRFAGVDPEPFEIALRRALTCFAQAFHEFKLNAKARLFRAARNAFSETIVHLLIASRDSVASRAWPPTGRRAGRGCRSGRSRASSSRGMST